MKLSKTQIEILEGIQKKLEHGDIGAIAKKTGLTRQYVGLVLNPKTDSYKENVVAEAISIISKREQNTKKLLQTLSEVA